MDSGVTSGHRRPGPNGERSFDELYDGTPPWDIGRPQPAFVALAEAGAIQGRVLDAGCGTGEHTLMAAALGCDVIGIDLAATALSQAERKARERGLAARFLRHDARDLAGLGATFDTVLDCALFHFFDGADRDTYVASLHSVLAPGGRFHMLAYSDRQPGGWRPPHGLARDDIIAAFADGWHLAVVEPATVETAIDPATVNAWLVTAVRN